MQVNKTSTYLYKQKKTKNTNNRRSWLVEHFQNIGNC